MPTDFTFRLSTYLSLALACLCLGYSEWDLLPEVTVFTVSVIVMLVVSFVTAGRFELDLVQANRVGMAVGLLGVVWVGWQFVRPSGGLIYVLPWPASLLPYLGPLLMVLMPAKLFRPKHAGDWWAMHGIGLVAVALATAITDDSTFGAIVFGYAVCSVWSVSLLLLRTWAGVVPPVPGGPAERPPAVSGPERSRTNVGRALLWLGAAAALALPAFFASPPYPGAKWQLAVKAAAETGLSADQVVDLNTGGGEIRVNRDIAFEFHVADPDGRPVTDFHPYTRFRAGAYNAYENGRWTLERTHLFRLLPVTRDPTGAGPQLGPGQYTIDYRPTARLPRPVLAEPIVYRPGQPAPVVTLGLTRVSTWTQTPDGSFIPLTVTDGRIGRYRQTTCPTPDPALGPPFELAPPGPVARGEGGAAAMAALTALSDLPRLQAWAQDRLAEFVRSGRLPHDVWDRTVVDPIRNRRAVAPADYEAVGRAFEAYFSTAKEFRYDLRIPRPAKDTDPTEDFVLNSRVGHCERFASALALSLRAVGVPAALVLGFSGCEPATDDPDGHYVVRQENAHAWVAILVPRPPPDWFPQPPADDGPPLKEVWHWLSLDPTPGAAADEAVAPGLSGWAKSAQSTLWTFYTVYITGYNEDRRREAVAAVRGHLGTRWEWYAAALTALGLGTIARVAVRRTAGCTKRPGPSGAGLPWYDAAIAALAAAGHPVRPGQTPREFARAVADELRADSGTADVADVPVQLAEAVYRVRYAGLPLTADDGLILTASAARLISRLRPTRSPEAPRG